MNGWMDTLSGSRLAAGEKYCCYTYFKRQVLWDMTFPRMGAQFPMPCVKRHRNMHCHLSFALSVIMQTVCDKGARINRYLIRTMHLSSYKDFLLIQKELQL